MAKKVEQRQAGTKTLTFRMIGVCPMMMHNIQLANPFNKWVCQSKEITAKGKKKTDDDMRELSRLEWFGGLYVNEDGRVILPSEVLLGCFLSGSKKSRLGTDFKCGFDVPMDAELEYDGPKDAEKLWMDKRFVDVRGVALQKSSRIMRTRPFFSKWECTVKVVFRGEVVNESQVKKAIEDAGMYCGIGDYRPRYGRFIVEWM